MEYLMGFILGLGWCLSGYFAWRHAMISYPMGGLDDDVKYGGICTIAGPLSWLAWFEHKWFY